VFVVLADYVPPALVTIASRCVTVPFLAVSTEKLAAVLEAEGASAEAALSAASSSGGNLGRARLLLSDPSCAARRRLWQSVPSRLDGSGLAAARTAEELLSSVSASMEVLVAAQKAEVAAALEERDRFGAVRGKGKKPRKAPAGVPKELEERHKRAQKAHRSEELKAGLSALAEVYRGRAATGREVEACARAVEQIDRFVSDLRFNPVELLQLQALLLRLS
jgi:hypothetical protein